MCAQLNLSHTLTAGTPENINDVQDNFQDIVDHVNNALIGDDNLTSPNNSVPRTVLQVGGCPVTSSNTAATYLLAGSNQVCTNGTAAVASARTWHPVSADLAVAGKTTQIRVSADVTVNSVAPVSNFDIGLVPVTAVAGGGAVMTYTLGTVVSNTLFTTPGANSSTRQEGSWATLPAAGTYVLRVIISATPAATSLTSISAAVEIRHS